MIKKSGHLGIVVEKGQGRAGTRATKVRQKRSKKQGNTIPYQKVGERMNYSGGGKKENNYHQAEGKEVRSHEKETGTNQE